MQKVKSCKAVGHSVVVEMLTEQEISDSVLFVNQEISKQAKILDIGPLMQKEAGLKVGDRVLLQGTYTPLPIKSKDGRTMGVVDLPNIKSVLVEE